MRYFVFLMMLLVGLWSAQSQALDSKMSFRIRELAPNQYEYSSMWNPVTEEALLRVGLVIDQVDPVLEGKNISFSSARKAEFVAKDWPEIGENCKVISDWHFEYSPGLPHYLMYMTLQGPGCQRVARYFDYLQIRLRFLDVSLINFEPIDVAVEISR
ncbi:MAG: hypothetical protein OM95_05670 [Bdellovibrio sp. ArHS]|uniref:hypothetical protein n=1 Tax=Bdellovibrio sp. ArHS TaxID=1569284 RepID=UPI0005835CC7|nr:hypothetical protein [Bdellovibrio sp. ArHS]KHD88956.1 MAG: hypothetical protein OM95_05670 [Bdellovibrio sp. ArHS]